MPCPNPDAGDGILGGPILAARADAAARTVAERAADPAKVSRAAIEAACRSGGTTAPGPVATRPYRATPAHGHGGGRDWQSSGGAHVAGWQGRRDGPAYAALDLGTNNCRLLVARPSRRGFLVIDAFSRIIRLGEGVSRTGLLSEIAMARTIDATRFATPSWFARKSNAPG